MFNVYNVADFGVRGIQFIQDFSFDDTLRRELNPPYKGLKKLWYQDTIIRKCYLKLCHGSNKSSMEGPKRNLTLVISDWSGRMMKEHFGMETHTLYPPVWGNYPHVPYHGKEDGFVLIGRIVPEKRVDFAISVLKEVRRRGHDIHFHIIGKMGSDSEYDRLIKRLCHENRDWVSLEEGVFGEKKVEMISRHKYGINTRESEPFGIVVAEMVKGGSIVFVPDSGGQVEIVDHPALIYQDIDDTVNKIERVLQSPELQNSLLKHLSVAGQRFSVENFIKDIKEIVADFLKSKEPA